MLRLLKLALLERLQQRVFARVALRLAERLPRVRHTALINEYAPQLVNRFFDVVTIQKSLAKLLLDGPTAALQVLLGLTLMAFYSPYLLAFDVFLILFIAFVVTVLGIGGLQTSIKESYQKYHVAEWLEELARCHRGFKLNGVPAFATAELHQARLQELFEKGLRSKHDLELAELEVVTQRTRLDPLEARLALARREVEAFSLDRERAANDTSAQLPAVRVSIASVRETIAKIDGDLLKLDVDIQNLDRRVAQRQVRAPRDGRLVRVLKVGAGETVKAGTVLAQIAPATNDQAAEIFLSDYDAPLVQAGDPVRLSFDGWPAIQFVG